MLRMLLGFFSRIAVRLLAFNLLVVFLPVAALLYLDTYEKQLLRSLESALVQQARILAAALAAASAAEAPLEADAAQSILRQLEQRHEARLRVVDGRGGLLADSSRLGPRTPAQPAQAEPAAAGPGRGDGDLPVSAESRPLYRLATYPVRLWRRVFGPPEAPLESAEFYVNTDVLLGSEIREALAGRYGAATRISTGGQRSVTLYSAVPVRAGGEVAGAVLASQSTYRILRDLYELRLQVFRVFLLSLAAAVVLSLLGSTTIAVPLRRLRRQAKEALDQRGRLRGPIRSNRRRDEIGDLSRSLEEMTSRLQAHVAFVEGFASEVSHEFKNPLASIRSAAEMSARAQSAEDRRRFLQLIQKQVQRMQNLLTGLREISLIDARLEEEGRSRVCLARAVEQAVDAHRLRGGAPVAVQVEALSGTLAVCMAPERLAQVIENLLENALGFARARVRIEVSRQGDCAVLAIQDDGPGIPAQNLGRVFDRFFSYRPQHGTGTAGPNGDRTSHLGLGLAIVKAIVTGYGGTVQAENGSARPGCLEGACFTVRLPALDL